MMLKYTRCTILLIVYVFLSGCYSSKYKENFARKKIHGLNKYGHVLQVDMLTTNSSKNKMKTLKKAAREMEKAVALMPDSLTTRPGKTTIDSFYSNINKIQYIRRHRLITPNKHFLKK